MGKAATPRALPENEAKAVARMLRVSPQKLNLVAALIRGKKVETALADLEFSRKRIARETFRLGKSRLPACDVVVRLSAPIVEVTRRMLREDLLSCFDRLVREAGKCAAS